MYYYNLLHRIHAIQTSEHPSIERDSLNPYANKSRCSDKFVGLLIKENGILKKKVKHFFTTIETQEFGTIRELK